MRLDFYLVFLVYK